MCFLHFYWFNIFIQMILVAVRTGKAEDLQNKVTLFLPSFPPDQQLIMAPKKDQGLDPKSIVINIATTFLFLLPFLSYFDRGNSMNYVKGVAASFAVAFIVPPVGWMRPHPYTDKPGNTPIGWKQK